MPAKGQYNMDLYKKKEIVVEGTNKTVRSQLKASENYDRNNVDNVRVRVPKGWKEQMQEYVKATDKYSSVNDMICQLIKKEVGIEDEYKMELQITEKSDIIK